MSVLKILLLAIQLPIIYGRLTVLREILNPTSSRKLTCVSEDDSSSLVWNYDVNIYKFFDPIRYNQITAFRNLNNNFSKNEIDCDLNTRNGCVLNWKVKNWSLTSSTKTPMGPVYDRRWEEFEQLYNNVTTDKYSFIHKLRRIESFAVSMRGLRDGYILICKGKNYTTDFCYWIIIGGWENKQSAIRKCAEGVPMLHKQDIYTPCQRNENFYSHKPLSPFEWRTFVVTWNADMRNLSVYDDEKLILTYVDKEINKEKQLSGRNTNYNMFLGSIDMMLFRLHKYNFFHTTDKEAVLESPKIFLTTKNICVEMAIGLCAECKLELTLVNSFSNKNEESLGIIKGSTVIGLHGLPIWQYARINKTISSNLREKVKIRVVPLLDQESSYPLWAIANVRMCPPTGSVRVGSMNTYLTKNFWPNETCQKLFYNESVVVSSVSPVNPTLELDDSDCPEGKVGPYCSINCTIDSQQTSNCVNAVICERSGCTCPPGFTDAYCGKKCNFPYYGQNCNHTCGQCNQQVCNAWTGKCKYGCNNAEGYKIAPFCNKGIDTPSLPNITFINGTSIRVVSPWKEEYQLVLPGYIFRIKQERGEYINGVQVIRNHTHIIGKVNFLDPGVSYMIALCLRINNFEIEGEWKNFTTPCKPNRNFEVEQKSRELILKTTQRFDSCGVKWYNFVVEDYDMYKLIYNGSLNTLPYKFLNLEPYTLYKITINIGPKTYFSHKVKTLDAAPSKVRNITAIKTSNSVTLTWSLPECVNGIIREYRIVLEVESYKGCTHLEKNFHKKEIKKFTKSNDIKISNLVPYVTYNAKIAACTSQCGDDNEKRFSTDQSEIPSEIYSNLRIEGYVLYWNLPEDCTTISGSMYTRVIIRGISKSVMNYTITKQTMSYKFELFETLYGAEEYEATVYVIRGYDKEHNSSAFRRIPFTTPPKPPPPVRDLDVYEVNSKTHTMHLRWKEPEPPINGKIKDYVVWQKYNTNANILKTVFPTEYCALWTTYICTTVTIYCSSMCSNMIHVAAENKNVTETGSKTSTKVIATEFPPDAPEIFHVKALAKGIVNVTWSHPWRTGGRLYKFILLGEMISTNLRETNARLHEKFLHEYPVKNYQAEYNYQMHLMPSTTYNIIIFAETMFTTSGERKFQVVTPSATDFEKDLTAEVSNEDSMILLHIPVVVNDTKNSITHVIVKGTKPCDHYAKPSPLHYKKADIASNEIAWRAATFHTNKFAGKTFPVGDNKVYEGAINCPLKVQESYMIVVILQTEEGSMNSEIKVAKTAPLHIGEVPKRYTTLWFILIPMCLIAAAIVYYLYRRKTKVPLRDVIPQEDMSLARNTVILEDKESSNSNRILVVTTDTPHKERLSSVNTPHDSPFVHDEIKDVCSMVKVNNFEDYAKQAIDSGLLDKQFNTLPRGQTKPWDCGKLPQNKPKNRYGNLIAYDEDRVILEKLPEDPHSDYINANYIKGYKKEKCYIATQGPKPNTINDFWRMIWQEQTIIICMLANIVETGKTKCEQYWPDIGKKKKYGELVVFNAKHTVFADYTVRTLHLKHGAETRKIEHLHYTAWPDHGVPFSTHSVVTYLKKLLATSPGNGPTVVHCSAGVGRTGTIILCDICLRRAAAEGVIDVFSETKSIRSQRANMVDTKQQYLFAHLTLIECLLSIPTSLPCDETLPMKIKELKKQLTIQQQSLEKATWQDEALRPATNQMSLSVRNLAKNRFPKLASANIGRVYLKRYPATDEDSDYISAVYVDGLKLQNQYIATQLPLPGTLSDFWRMVDEYKVELIVELQPPDPDDKTCCSIVPSKEFKPVPYINIKTKECTEYEYYKLQKLTLENKMEKPLTEQQVIIIHLTEWKAGENQAPPLMIALVTLWQATERIARGRELTIVMCHDGITGCGLFLALSILLERMSVERECDVCLAIRAVRRSNNNFVRSLEQMEYLYDAANTYLKYFETYANFT